MKDTLIESAKKENITSTISKVSEIEGIDPHKLANLIAKGRVVIPKNVLREHISPKAVGECVSTKVNANIGTSREHGNVEEELLKAKTSVLNGADTVMDLSTGKDINSVRRQILKEIDVPIGTVPIYQAASEHSSVLDMTEDDMFNAVRLHVKDGVDFVTIHTGVTLRAIDLLRSCLLYTSPSPRDRS